MYQKRIMVLGGNIVQMEAILEAKRQGYYVISADLHEDNPGHKVSDEYCKIDIIDKEVVLNEARRLKIDGIMPYSSDILAPVAAYVAEQMGLPGNPYKAVMTLAHKNMFRKFLVENGYPCPFCECFSSKSAAVSFYEMKKVTCIMKPTDSSSCCGVFRIDSSEDIINHWQETVAYSSTGEAIIEQFIERVGYQQDGDVFLVDGKIIFDGRCDQHKTATSPFVPVSLSYPSSLEVFLKIKAIDLLQDIFTKLGVKTGPFNVEYVVGEDNNIYFLDIGPRNGGWRTPFMEFKATGFNELMYTVRAAVGDELPFFEHPLENTDNAAVMYYIVYADRIGIFHNLWLSEYYRQTVFDITMLMPQGTPVEPPVNGRGAVAVIYSRFDSYMEMLETIQNMDKHLRVIVE